MEAVLWMASFGFLGKRKSQPLGFNEVKARDGGWLDDCWN
jgi:hypothetical protein